MRALLSPLLHPPDADVTRAVRSRPRSAASLFAVPALAVGAVVVAGAIVLGRALIAAPPATGGPLLSLLVAIGDRAVATGWIVEHSTGAYSVCRLGNSRLMNEPPACVSMGVALAELDPALVPGWQTSGGVRFSATTVSAHGTWTSAGLRVDRVDEVTLDDRRPGVPCPTPAGGWPPLTMTNLEEEAALRALNAQIDAAPDRFSGLWRAYRSASDVGVVVVGTVADPASVEPTLKAAYPGPLCVTLATHSRADLERVAGDLRQADPTIGVEIAPDLDRVIARVGVVDDKTLREFGANAPLIWPDPVLRPGERPAP